MDGVNHSMLLSCGTLRRALVLPAAKHNLREIGGPHIDQERRDRNVILCGPATADAVMQLAEQRMDATGLDLEKQRSRKNGTLAGEILFGLPASTPVDTGAYFRACVAWVGATFGDDVVLSAVIHHDESAPHCHVLMLPMRRGRWMASDIFGKKGDLVKLQADFFQQVAAGFGLRASAVRLSAAAKTELAAGVIRYLKEQGDSVLLSQTWPVVRAAVDANPRPWAEQLGIELPATAGKRLKTMAEIFTGTGKGERREETPIGDRARPVGNSLPSVLGDFLSGAPDVAKAQAKTVGNAQAAAAASYPRGVSGQVRSTQYAAEFAAKEAFGEEGAPGAPELEQAAVSTAVSAESANSAGAKA